MRASNKISGCDFKIDDIEAAAGRRDDLKDTAEDGDEDKWNQEDMEEKNEEEVISSVAELQEQLDEIRTNMIANNGRLDDVVLNKLLNIYGPSLISLTMISSSIPLEKFDANLCCLYAWETLSVLLITFYFLDCNHINALFALLMMAHSICC